VDASGNVACTHCGRSEQLDAKVVDRLRKHVALVRSMEEWVDLRNRRSMAFRGQPSGRRAEIESGLFLVWNVAAFVALMAAATNAGTVARSPTLLVAVVGVVVGTAVAWVAFRRRYGLGMPPPFKFGGRTFRVATCPRCGGSIAVTASLPACPFCEAELALTRKAAASVRRAMFAEVEAERVKMAARERGP
jgi:hypothetical protein